MPVTLLKKILPQVIIIRNGKTTSQQLLYRFHFNEFYLEALESVKSNLSHQFLLKFPLSISLDHFPWNNFMEHSYIDAFDIISLTLLMLVLHCHICM